MMETLSQVIVEKNLIRLNRGILIIVFCSLGNIANAQISEILRRDKTWKDSTLSSIYMQMSRDSAELYKIDQEAKAGKTVIVEHYWHKRVYGNSFWIMTPNASYVYTTNNANFVKIELRDVESILDKDLLKTNYSNDLRKIEDILIVTEVNNKGVFVHTIIAPTQQQIDYFTK